MRLGCSRQLLHARQTFLLQKNLVYVPLVTDSGTTTLGAWLLAIGSPSLVDLVCDVPNWSNASSNSLVATLKDDHFWKVE